MRKTEIRYYDDRDGKEIAPPRLRERTLTIDGVEYGWDLHDLSSDTLDELLKPWLKCASRKVKVGSVNQPPEPPPPGQPEDTAGAPAAEPVEPAEEAEAETAPAPEPTPAEPETPAGLRVVPRERPASRGDNVWRDCQESQLRWAGEVSVQVCDWPGSDRIRGQKGHLRMAHGIGGTDAYALRALREANAAEAAAKVAAAPKTPAEITMELRAKIAERKDPEPIKPAPPALRKVTVGRLEPKHTIVPGVNVVLADAATKTRHEPRVQVPGKPSEKPFGERTEQVATNAVELHERWKHGLPEDVGYSFSPDVLALHGMDQDLMNAALRNPEWVEIAPETYTKGYTVLRFHRGDAMAVLGCKYPSSPALIAAYHGSLLEHDVHRVNHHSGGGGARRRVPTGLPQTPRQSIQYLQAAGAEVEWDETADVTSVPVSFQGQDLGRITVGTVQRSQVETDYQRTLRKVAAIKAREQSGAAVG